MPKGQSTIRTVVNTTMIVQDISVLLVDDNLDDIKMLEHLLARIPDLRVNLQKASTIAAAEKYLKEGSIQAILLDLSMTDSSGVSSVKRLMNVSGDRPIIVLAGFSDSHSIAKALDCGAQDYLSKEQLSPELLHKTLLFAIRYQSYMAHLIKNQENLTRSNNIKDEFLAVVSHELRTPMTSILGYFKILSKDCKEHLKPEQKEYFECIMRNSNHLMEIINSLLDLSKLDKHVEEMKPKSLKVSTVIEHMLESFAVQSVAESRSVTIDDMSDADLSVFADPRMLNQVLGNLITNAMKYSAHKRPIKIGFRTDFRDGKKGVFLWVKDEGEGVLDNIKERIFDKFFQADKHMKRKTGGLGLGLSIVKSIMELHNGKTWVENNEGQGSIFCVFFPDQIQVAEG